MKIKLTYNNITIEMESKGLEASCDLILITGAILEKTQELHYGNPTLEKWDTEDLKVAPSPKP